MSKSRDGKSRWHARVNLNPYLIAVDGDAVVSGRMSWLSFNSLEKAKKSIPRIKKRYPGAKDVVVMRQDDYTAWANREVPDDLPPDRLVRAGRAAKHKPVRAITKDSLVELLAKLSDAERLEVFSYFCKHCGSNDPGCQCWNDE